MKRDSWTLVDTKQTLPSFEVFSTLALQAQSSESACSNDLAWAKTRGPTWAVFSTASFILGPVRISLPQRVGNLRRLRSEILLNLQDLDGSKDEQIQATIHL